MTYSDVVLQKKYPFFDLLKWGCWSLTKHKGRCMLVSNKAQGTSYETISVGPPIRLFICVIVNQ